MPFFLSLFILTMIPPSYAVSPPGMNTPFVEHCTGEFAESAEHSLVNQFENETDQMLAALFFGSAKAFLNVTSREVCICFESAYSTATGPSSPLSIDDLWSAIHALERNDSNTVDAI